MKSQLDVRLGAQEPVILHSPPDVVSLAAAEDAIELADAYGVCDGNPLSESQKITLRNGGGERADGSWAATRVADFGPRQGTGKNDKIAAWELAHLLLFGTDLILHTAHEFPTANESFLRLVAVFDAWDELRKKVARIRYANGEQGIELLTGQRLKYRARTGGSGRGFAKAGLIVYDEAQHLGREHIAASGPAKLANPNSQTWYAGSGGLATSVVAWEIRRAALLGTGGRLAYTEMTGETISVDAEMIDTVAPDPTDREVWYRCIPGLGRWVTEEAVEALYAELGSDLFAREILCVWDPDPTSSGNVFGSASWDRVCGDHALDDKQFCYSVDANPERAMCSIGASDGRVVELLERRPGMDWPVTRLLEMQAKRKGPVAVDPAGPAGSFIEELERHKIEVVPVTGRDMAHACGQLFDAVVVPVDVDPGVRIRTDARLTAAASAAVKKSTAGDGFIWDRKSGGDVAPLVAVTIARFAALAAKKKPLFVY